jgi:putative ABC transport system permease protein
MILHWFTTAWRSLIRNPLFSAITIISLSIGCCGALLAGSNIMQHASFERFHKDADRILIVARTVEDQGPVMIGQNGQRIASTFRTEGPGASRPQTTVAMPM